MTQPSERIPAATFAIVVTGAFVVALDLSIVNVAFPSLEASFPDTSTATLSWVLSAYSVVFGALLLAGGRIADRSGRKLWFMRGLTAFAAGSALCGFAPSAALLIAGRAVQAAGAAVLLPASLGLLLAAASPAARAPAVAMWGGVSALGVAVGPSLGAVIVDAGGWRWAFFVNLPIAVIALLGARARLTESAAGGAAPDLVGVALLSGAVGALALAITQGRDWGWTTAPILASLAAAAVLAPAAVRRAATHPSPAIDLSVFRSRTVSLANAAILIFSVGFFAMLLSSVLFLTSVWQYSTLTAGLAITPGPLLVALLSRSTGRLSTRIGYRPVLVGGAAAFTAGMAWYAERVGPDANYLGDWLPAALLVGVGVAMTFPVLSAAAVAGLPPDRFAVGGALSQTSRQIGAVFGVALLVAVIGAPAMPAEALDAFRDAWLLCAAAAFASGVISAFHRAAAGRVPVAAPVPPAQPEGLAA